MKNFYLTRLEKKPAQERQSYLDETVVVKYRDEVRREWNLSHPSETLK